MPERESRGRATTRDPAEAIAMAKCWLSTWAGRTAMPIPNAETFHPAQCGYCDVPRDWLIQALEEFKEWSKISDAEDWDTPLRLEIEQWLVLPAHEQERLVMKAQGNSAAIGPVQEATDKQVLNDWWNTDG